MRRLGTEHRGHELQGFFEPSRAHQAGRQFLLEVIERFLPMALDFYRLLSVLPARDDMLFELFERKEAFGDVECLHAVTPCFEARQRDGELVVREGVQAKFALDAIT